MGVVGLIFELHLQNFAKSYNFYRCTIDVIIIFWYLYLCEIQKISVGVLRPYLEVSLPYLIASYKWEGGVLTILKIPILHGLNFLGWIWLIYDKIT